MRSIFADWEDSSSKPGEFLSDSEEFWAKENDILRLFDDAATTSCIKLCGSVREESDSVIEQLYESTDWVRLKSRGGLFWVASTWKSLAFLEISEKFKPAGHYFPLRREGVQFRGILCGTWQVFLADALRTKASYCMLIGVNNQEEPPTSYARMRMEI